MRNYSLLPIVLLCVVATGCLRPLRMPEQELLNTARIAEITQKRNLERQRLSGRFQTRATGIQQLFGKVDLIVALQSPSSFYVSVPSFFEMPARVVTSDGGNLYLLDLSGQGPQYLVKPSNSQVLDEWLGLPIEPTEFVNALLGRLNFENTNLVDTQVSYRRRRYELFFTTGKDRILKAEFDADNDDLLSQTLLVNNRLFYQIQYSDFRDHKGLRFPWQTEISIRAKESIDLQLSAVEIDFPNEPFEIDTFQIEEP